MNQNQYTVVAAAYGALENGDPDTDVAYDVTSTLQSLLDDQYNSTAMPISNSIFGDPAPKYPKHFGAVVIVNGKRTAFACAENQKIDFA